jgi:YihY family inner membrane protein
MASAGFISALVDRVDGWQQRRRVPAVLVGIVVKYREDRGQQYAALLSYYGFISMFPLLLLFVAILSVVLDQSPSLRDKIIDSILGRLPVIGTQISNQVDGGLNVHGSLFVVGTLALLWAGLKVVRHAQDAFNDQWDVPPHEQPTVVVKAIRGALTLVVLGAGIVAATIVTGLAAFLPDLGGSARLVGALIAIVANTLFLLASYEILTRPRIGFRALLPGALIGGTLLWLLQLIGGTYVTRIVANASDVYGAFAGVFGLLIWIALLARVVLLSGELNVVLNRHAWPRSLHRLSLPQGVAE